MDWGNTFPNKLREKIMNKQKRNPLKQTTKIQATMDEKRYFVTTYVTGHKFMSGGDTNRQVFPKETWSICSTNELIELMRFTKEPFWRNYTDLKDKDVPYEEKKWGIYQDIIIEPFTEELEKSYIKASKDDFFKMHRELHIEQQKHREMKECA